MGGTSAMAAPWYRTRADAMIEMKVHESMRDVPRADWDLLVGPDVPPFLSHTSLAALEQAGCGTPGRGWLPMPLPLGEEGQPAAAAPAYVKGNSEGEFV